jgi:hypothetical protein
MSRSIGIPQVLGVRPDRFDHQVESTGAVDLLSSVEDARKLASRRVRVAFQQDVAVPASLPQGYEMIDAKPRTWILRVTGQLGSLPSFLVALPVADLAVEETRLEDVLVKYYRDGAE